MDVPVAVSALWQGIGEEAGKGWERLGMGVGWQ